MFIQQNFYTDIVINKIKLTNLLYDAIYFLSCKIYYVKIQSLLSVKSNATEKKLRLTRRIEMKKKVFLDKTLKKSADDV